MEQDQPTGFARQEGPSRLHDEGPEENPRVRAQSMVHTYGTDRSSSPSYSPNFSSSPTSSPHREGPSRQSFKRHHSRRHARKRHRSPSSSSSSSRERSSTKQRIFKAGDKDIKFDTYNGKRDVNKALSFIRQFDVAFAGGRLH